MTMDLICGIKDFAGCNCRIERVADLYRCTDCGVAMHKTCLLAHFNGAHRPHPLRETQLMEALAEKEREIIRLRAKPVSAPCGTPQGAGDFIPSAQRWEVGKNGWDASDEATREDI